MNRSGFPDGYADWYRRVLLLAWPIILSNLSVPLVGVVDTAVTGHLPDPVYMGAVAIGATIFSSVFWLFGFLRMGTTGIVSQAFGREDNDAVAVALMRSFGIAGILGLLVVVLQGPIGWLAFKLMAAPREIGLVGESYFSIRVWSAPATFVNYCVLGCLIGMQKTRWALYTQLVLNLTNVALDLLFVVQFGMDSDGVALASVISEYVAAVFGLWVLREVIGLAWRKREVLVREIIDSAELKSVFHLNGNLLLRTLFLTAGFFFLLPRVHSSALQFWLQTRYY